MQMKAMMFTLNKVTKIRKLDRAKCWQRYGYIVANINFWESAYRCVLEDSLVLLSFL